MKASAVFIADAKQGIPVDTAQKSLMPCFFFFFVVVVVVIQ